VKTGRVFIDISDDSDVLDIKDEIEEICEELLPFGFDINIGKFIRTQRTVTDNIKYGDGNVSDDLIGMTDQSAKLKDRVTILKKD
jgi:methyl-coenzyme M reductase subunit D